MSDFELNLTKQVQDHPSLKALTIKEECSMLLFKGAVAGMSKRGSVEKLVVTGNEPLCWVSLSESPTCQLIVCLSCLCVVWWYSVVYACGTCPSVNIWLPCGFSA